MPTASPSQVLILTHEHTDFDALASMLAASRLYPQSVPVLPRQINRNLEAFLPNITICCRSCTWKTCRSGGWIM